MLLCKIGERWEVVAWACIVDHIQIQTQMEIQIQTQMEIQMQMQIQTERSVSMSQL